MTMQLIQPVLSVLSMLSLIATIFPFKAFRSRKIAFLTLLACFGLISLVAPRPEKETMASQPPAQATPVTATMAKTNTQWVAGDRLARHTCPSTKCGNVGTFFFREAVDVLEVKDEWARVTEPYDGSCRNGSSDYVDSGPKACSSMNGFIEGRFAEWVQLAGLTTSQPADPAAGAVGVEQLVAESDDYLHYKAQFVKAAQTLLDSGQCTAADFRENGGFMKSVNQRSQPVYFTYCGGWTLANRLYLNASTGAITR